MPDRLEAVPKVIEQAFPIVGKGDLELTLNLWPKTVRVFVEDEFGRCFVSRDEQGLPGENVVSNMARLYSAVGAAPPERFAALALRTEQGGTTLATTLRAYGSLVLRLDLDRLGPELVIVNGDAKNVAFKIAEANDNRFAIRIPWSDRATVAQQIRGLFENGRFGKVPRIHGSYVEARLPRPLVLGDVVSVHVDPRDAEAVEAARRLCA